MPATGGMPRRLSSLLVLVCLVGWTAEGLCATKLNAPVAVAAAPPAVSTGLAQVPDLNGDDIPDLVVANPGTATVGVFFGTGSGFPTAPDVTLGPIEPTHSVAVADLDGDGITDIVVGNFKGSATYVETYYGNRNPATNKGDGTFTNYGSWIVTVQAVSVAVGRLRSASPLLDIVTAGRSRGFCPSVVNDRGKGELSIQLGQPGRGFSTPRCILPGRDARAVVLGDFGTSATDATPDGNLDIAVTVRTDNAVAVVYGDGTGAFSAPKKYAAGPLPEGLVTGDFNNDGCPDLATTSNRGTAKVFMLLGECSGSAGSFAAPVQVADLGRYAKSSGITTVDLNGDGKLDLAVTRGGPRHRGALALLVNDIDVNGAPMTPRFKSPVLCTVGDNPMGITAGSFNPSSDAIDDLAVANPMSDNISILFGNGVGASCPIPTQIGLP